VPSNQPGHPYLNHTRQRNAPTGRRYVATGEAQRNPWSPSPNHPLAPTGRRTVPYSDPARFTTQSSGLRLRVPRVDQPQADNPCPSTTIGVLHSNTRMTPLPKRGCRGNLPCRARYNAPDFFRPAINRSKTTTTPINTITPHTSFNTPR